MESDIKPSVVEPVLDTLYNFDSLETTEGQDEKVAIPIRVFDDFIRQMEEQITTLLNLRIPMDNDILNVLKKRRDMARSEAKLREDAGSEFAINHEQHKLFKAMDNNNNYTKDEEGFNSTENHHTKNNDTLNVMESNHTMKEEWSNNNEFTKSTYAIMKDNMLKNIAMIDDEISIIENDELEIDNLLMERDHPKNDTLIIEKNNIEKDKQLVEDNPGSDNLIIEKDNPGRGIPIIIITEAEEEKNEDENATAVSPNDNDEEVPLSKSKKRRLRKKRKLQEIKLKKLEKMAKRAALKLIPEDTTLAVKTAETDGSGTDKKQKKDGTVEGEENEVVIVDEDNKHSVVVEMRTGDKICLENTEDEVVVEEKDMSETARHVIKDEIENQLNFLRKAIEEMANAEKKNKHEISPEVMVATAVFNYMVKEVGEKFKTPVMERVQDIIFLFEYFNIYMMILLYSILFYKLLFSIFCGC